MIDPSVNSAHFFSVSCISAFVWAGFADVEERVSTANAARAFAYPYLLPSRISNSTNI